MASTYIITTGAAIAPAASTHMAYIRNQHATKVMRVYRIWAKNTFLGTAFSGGLALIQVSRATGYTSGGTAMTVSKCDSTSATPTLNTDMNCLRATGITGVTLTPGGVLRQVCLINEELTAKAAVNSEVLWGQQQLCCLWDSGYGDSNIQPITLRQNEGLTLYCPAGITAGGGYDFTFEVTWA